MSAAVKANYGHRVALPAPKRAVDCSRIPHEIQSGLASLREDKVCTDFEVIVCGQSFHCHKAVLASLSAYFRAMFTSGMKESFENQTTLDNITPETFQVIIDLLYNTVSDPDPFRDRGDNELCELLRVTDMFQMTTLSKLCLEYFSNTMTAANCVQRWKTGKRSISEELQKISWKYLMKHFESVAKESVLVCLDFTELVTIIKDDYLVVSNEVIVWEVISDWMEFDMPIRAEKITELIKHVCLTEIDHQMLAEEIAFDEKICSSPVASKLVQNAIKFQNHPSNHVNTDLKFRECSGKEQVSMMLGLPKGGCQYILRYFSTRMNKWESMKVYEIVDTDFACCMHGQNIYVSGGIGPHGDVMHKYSTVYGVWEKCEGKITFPLSRHAMVATDSCLFVAGGRKKLFVAGGRQEHTTNGAVLQYCLHSEMWEQHGEIIAPVEQASAVYLNNKIYIFGGVLSGIESADSVQVYDISTKTTSIPCHLPSPCSFSCATVRLDQILVATSKGEIIKIPEKNLEPALVATIPNFEKWKGFVMEVKGDTVAVYDGNTDNEYDPGQACNVTYVNHTTGKIWNGKTLSEPWSWFGCFNIVIGQELCKPIG